MSCRTCACRGNCNQRRPRPASSYNNPTSNNSLRRGTSASSPKTTNSLSNNNNNRSPVKNVQKRASSAGKSEETTSTTKLISSSSKKIAASDSKLTQTIRNAKTQKHLKDVYLDSSDSETPLNLKDDLKAIKDQLKILTDNKNEALGITNELHERYKLLASKNEQQEKEIEELKAEKIKLLKKIDNSTSNNNDNQQQPQTRRRSSSVQYAEKLEVLHPEKSDSTKAMEQIREQICKCMRQKSEDFAQFQEKERRLSKSLDTKDTTIDELQEKERRLSKSLETKDTEVAQLRKKIDEITSDKNKSDQQIKEISDSFAQIQNRLNEALENLGKFQNLELASRTRENKLKQQIMLYAKKLEEKSMVMSQMSATVEELKQHVCECNKKTDQVDTLQQKYHELQCEHNNLIKKFRQNEANDVRRYNQNVQMMKAMQDRERQLVEERQKLRNIVSQLTRVVRENEETIDKMSCLCEEKDFIIQSQMKDLEAKNKQVTLVSSSFMQTKRFSADPMNKNESCLCTTAGDSTPKLAQELEELIAALYTEIEKSLAKEQIIRDQFRNICCLQRALVSKEHEVGCVRCELASLKKKLSESVQQNELLLEELKIIEAQNSTGTQDVVLECYSDCADQSESEPMSCPNKNYKR